MPAAARVGPDIAEGHLRKNVQVDVRFAENVAWVMQTEVTKLVFMVPLIVILRSMVLG